MIRNLSIKYKFMLVTVLITTVLLVFSIFMIQMIDRLATVTSDIFNHPLEVSNAASYANVEVLRMHRDLKDILLAEEDYEINILVDRIRVSESQVYIALDTIAYDILGDEGKALESEARKLFNEWKDLRSEIIEAVRDGDKETALEITRSRGADHISALEQKLTELNQYARKKAEGFQENSIELEKSTERTTILGIIVVLLVIALAVYYMIWSFLTGINQLSTSLKGIMKSGEYQNVTLVGNNEITELSIIFNDLVKDLKGKLWVKEGNKTLSSLLANSDNLKEGINDYVEFLADYGNFLSVAYYHHENDLLSLLGVVNRIDMLDHQYKLGDKIVGEVALKHQKMIIEYDGIDRSLPFKELIAMPVVYNEDLFGVLCLVLKSERNDDIDELIEETTSDLSAFVSTHVQRTKIDDLLQQSILANEQLTERQATLEENQSELKAVNTALQEQRDLLNTKSTELTIQNAELVNLREELEEKYVDLEEVTKYRSQFITNISHELRTPLNSIVVLSNMLSEKTKESLDDHDVEKIKVISKASNELLEIINDILDLSKIEKGKVDLYEEIFSPQELVDELHSIYAPMIKEKGLKSEFVNTIDEDIFGDKKKISHIMTNYISNAIKFTHEGKIRVTIKRQNDVNYPIRIDVKDTGIGIDKEKFDNIFEEFVQTDGSISRIYGGTGLGLSICKSYADLINAKIDVKSQLGKGSTFSLMLPSASILNNYNEKNKLETVASEGKTRLLKEHFGKKILICDDEPMNVFALSAMLEDIGLVPVAALDAYEVLEIYKVNSDISMIMIDYMMPDIDGFSTMQMLKALDGWKDIPTAIITAATLSDEKLEELQYEGYRLVKKPIIYNRIVDVLNQNL